MRDIVTSWDSFHKQHDKIARIIGELQDISGLNVDFERVNKTIDDVVNYTKEHFHDEEQLMERLHYPRLIEHQRQHRDLIDKVQNLCFGSNNQLSDPVEELLTVFNDWTEHHIATEDRELEQFILQQLSINKNQGSESHG